MYIFMSVNMYATRRCTHGVPTVYPYPQYPWLTQPEGRRVRVLTGMGTGQPGITRGLPVLIPTHRVALGDAAHDAGTKLLPRKCRISTMPVSIGGSENPGNRICAIFLPPQYSC